VAAMAAAGLVEEVQGLRGRLGPTAGQALGYREVATALEAGTSVQDALDETVRRTRTFARRQLRWFRRDPRITWDDGEDGGRARERLGEWLSCA